MTASAATALTAAASGPVTGKAQLLDIDWGEAVLVVDIDDSL
ncbi:hypothetical protein SAMN02745165_02059 [Malonomonas rubra DSM 5091]|uniref:Uncharacterized protein n=1 Tax=Malonomonas rubra DSM 5091 TaxID=1122189 RepID=A0A1M6I8F3_MALRU|nr:hypothetical protein SAMN02745165_02059 [Malonomonas rubra DSM 5091]